METGYLKWSRNLITAGHALGTPCSKPDHFTGSDAAEHNCQGCTAYVNTLLGNNVPAKRGYGPCWANKGKDENELGTFPYKVFIYTEARKGMWYSEWGLLLCTAGIIRNLWDATKGKQFTKADRADLSHYIFYNLNLCYDRCHHIHKRTQT